MFFFLELFSLEIFVGSKEYVKKLKKKKNEVIGMLR